jgi:hypothetical protein
MEWLSIGIIIARENIFGMKTLENVIWKAIFIP